MAKALVKSPARKTARTTGTRAKAKAKTPAKGAATRGKKAAAKPAKSRAKKDAAAKGARAPKSTPAKKSKTTPKATAAKSKPAKSTKAAKPAKPARPAKPAAAPAKVNGVKRPPAKSAQPGPGDPRGQLKERFAKLSQAKSRISGLKRSINKSFFDVGVILNQIRDERLYEVKGYGSFESFVEREIDLNKAVCLRSARIAVAITRDEAEAAGLERASAAVAALDGEEPSSTGFRPAGSPVGSIPIHKR